MRGSQIILVLLRGTVARGTVARDTYELLIFMLNPRQCCLMSPFESETVTLNH